MNSKRLDQIDLQLTPKQWAIRLADQMRSYPSQEDFLKAVAKGTYREFPFLAPFFVLSEQAIERWPETNPKDIRERVKLDRKLRMEFQALKTLIIKINNAIQRKAETDRLKAAVQLSSLHGLILQDVFVPTDIAIKMSASPAGMRHLSLLEDWADKSAMLLMEISTFKRAVQTVQERYFENHPILYKDVEAAFETANRTVREAITMFNEYRSEMANMSNESDQEQQRAGTTKKVLFERESKLPIDVTAVEERQDISPFLVEKWVSNAKTTSTADILRENYTHEEFEWQHFRKEMGLES